MVSNAVSYFNGVDSLFAPYYDPFSIYFMMPILLSNETMSSIMRVYIEALFDI